jgi:hypothetical protein
VPAGIGAGAQARAPSDTDGPLLYVAHARRGNRAPHEISIWSLRQGRAIARITGYGYVTGVCTDTAGDVWVSSLRFGRWRVDKFARGGTKAVEELRAPGPRSYLGGCAVDPTSGDLAVVGANIDGGPQVLIWSGARKGKPAEYPAPFQLFNAAYDDDGNLFLGGNYGGSFFLFEMGELVRGSSRVISIRLDKHTGIPGDVQWDGKYVVVDTTVDRHSVLYRVQVSGKKGHVVQVVTLHGFCPFSYMTVHFVLRGRGVIGMAGKDGDRVWAWPYPGGGQPTRAIARYDRIDGLAISN